MTDPAAPQVFTPASAFRLSPPAPGGGDIWCVGPADLERLGESCALLLFTFTDEGRVYSHVTVITPPDGPAEQAIHAAVVTAIRSRAPEDDAATIARLVAARTLVRATSSLDPNDVINALPFDVPPRQAVIIAEAARFVGGTLGDMAERRWTAGVATLARRACGAAVAKQGYVLLDTGEAAPRSEQALASLTDAHDNCSVTTARPEGDDIDQLVAAANQIDVLADAHRFGEALAAVDALAVDETMRLGLKVGVYLKAGLPAQAIETLQAIRAAGPLRAVAANLQFAHFAHQARHTGLTVHFLAAAVERATTVHDLEGVLRLAGINGNETIAAAAAQRLEALLPNSPVLLTYRLDDALQAGDLTEAADLLAAAPDRASDAEFYRRLNERLTDAPGYAAALAWTDEDWPDFASQALRACIVHAQRHGLRLEAVNLLLNRVGETPAEQEVRQLVSAMRSLLLNDQGTPADQIFEALVATTNRVLGRLSASPSDAASRAALGNLLSTEESGLLGRGALHAVLATRIGQRPDATVAEPERRPSTADQLEAFQTACEAWLMEAALMVTGRSRCPAHLVPPSFDGSVLCDLVASTEQVAETIDEPGGVTDFLRYVTLIAGFAPHVNGPDRDLDILALKLAATQLARANQRQAARDLIETVLNIVGDDPARARAAWFAYGEAHRLAGDPDEATLAIAAGLGREAAITPTAAWHEALDIIRLLRDLGEPGAARRFIPRAREMLEALEMGEAYGSRLETLRLQIEQHEVLSAQPLDRDRLGALMADAVTNGRSVLELNEDTGPIAAVLSQTLRLGRSSQAAIPADADAVSNALMARLPAAAAQRLRRFLADPTIDDLSDLARELEGARYGHNLVQDVSHLVMLARRHLAGPQTTPVGAAFAVELLADHGLLLRDEFGLETPARLPTAPTDVLATAQAISTTGLAVALLGLDEDGRLTRIEVVDGAARPPVREPEAVFSMDRLLAWRREFPARYATLAGERDDAGRLRDGFQLIRAFDESLQGVGVSNLPGQRVVVVPDASIADVPVNLLPADGVFAGAQRAMAAAPSLQWLAEAEVRRTLLRGPSHCWIPTVGAPEDSLLPRVAETLGPILTEAGIGISLTAELPGALEGAELAIVAAHGDLAAFEGRFFRGVSDEAQRVMAAERLAHGLAGAKVAILFVCSGARLDQQPDAQATLGLARHLLDRGCSAVIGAPWPLRGDVPERWLPAFLEAWNQDLPVADANSFANEAVGGAADTRHALHVYGDPLVRRQGG